MIVLTLADHESNHGLTGRLVYLLPAFITAIIPTTFEESSQAKAVVLFGTSRYFFVCESADEIFAMLYRDEDEDEQEEEASSQRLLC